MNTELVIAIASIIGAVVSMIAAVSSYRREEVKARLEVRKHQQEEETRRKKIASDVANETVGLYRRLSEQYEAMGRKDKKLLRTISFVIRRLLVLDRTTTDLLTELEVRLEQHQPEADGIDCPYFQEVEAYIVYRIRSIEEIIDETMQEIDNLLLNGNGNGQNKQ